MTLTRTKSGLQNMHIVKCVDLVVYTEGGEGESFTMKQVHAGGGYENSDDIRFWKVMFEHYLPGTTVWIRALGGCAALKKIAVRISESNLQNVCVAMDRDYSVFLENYVEHQRVVRTRTYSWENELFQTEIILRASIQLGIEALNEFEARNIIDDARNTLLVQLEHLLRADLVLVDASKSLFCRQNPASCFTHAKCQQTLPEINRAKMKEQLRRKKAEIGWYKLKKRPSAAEIDISRDIFGKPLLIASIRILQYLIRRAGQKSIHNGDLQKGLLDAFHEWIAAYPETETAKYYADKFSVILDSA